MCAGPLDIILFWKIFKVNKAQKLGRSHLSTGKHQFSYDHWSQAMLSVVVINSALVVTAHHALFFFPMLAFSPLV